MVLDLSSLHKAIVSFDSIMQVTHDDQFMSRLNTAQKKGFKAGIIQNFEFTYELCWKFMLRWLDYNVGKSYVDGISRRELFRLAAEHKLISDVDKWMDYHKYRNLTSHTYDEDVAEEIIQIAEYFLLDAKVFLQNIEKCNA